MHYIHIGMHKAGSTTVQNFLSNNVEVLRRNGLDYPTVARDTTSHHRLVYALQPKTDQDASLCEQMKDTISQSERSIVLSAEGLEYTYGGQIRALRNIFGSTPCKVIFYIRSFEELIPSKYTQRTKTGLNISTIDDFVETALTMPWLKIADTIDKWTTHFTPVAFAVSQLERLEKRTDALERQLWRNLDLADGDFDEQVETADARSNPSPHWIAVEFVRAINQELNRSAIDWSDLAGMKRIKTRHIMRGDDKAEVRHINGLLPVLQEAVARCGLDQKGVVHLRQSDRLRIRDFYNAEIARLNSRIGTDLRPAEETAASDREELPSVELLSTAEREAVWKEIARSRKVASLPEVVQEQVRIAVTG